MCVTGEIWVIQVQGVKIGGLFYNKEVLTYACGGHLDQVIHDLIRIAHFCYVPLQWNDFYG